MCRRWRNASRRVSISACGAAISRRRARPRLSCSASTTTSTPCWPTRASAAASRPTAPPCARPRRRTSPLSCATRRRSTVAWSRRRACAYKAERFFSHRGVFMKIVVLPGDGIGPETMAVAVEALEEASRRFGLGLQLEHDVAGHASLQRHGATVTPALLEKVRAADGLMLGPMATYDFKDESKGEINPSKFFRKSLDLYANIRPARTYRGMPARLGEFDRVVVRENTEGFYADRNVECGGSEMLITPDVVVSLRRITRQCCERIARTAFELAMTRKKHVTIVHKANV